MSQRPAPDINVTVPSVMKKARITTGVSQDLLTSANTTDPNNQVAGGLGPSDTTKEKRLLGLEALPLNILLCIASGLSTSDLLNLARISRPLRAILMSKSSASIWRAARQNMGIPDGPDDLSEPLLAEVIFGRTCSLCRGEGDIRVLEQRLRLCYWCYSGKYISITKRVGNMKTRREETYSLFRSLFPFSIYEEDKNDFASDDSGTEDNDTASDYGCWDIDSFRKVLEKYQSYPPGSRQRAEFVKVRKEYVDKVYKHADAVDEWCRKMGYQNRHEIETKLLSMGYSAWDLEGWGDTSSEKESWETIMRDCGPLTSTRWKKILPELEELIENRRDTQERRIIAENLCNGDQDEAQFLVNAGYRREYDMKDSDSDTSW